MFVTRNGVLHARWRTGLILLAALVLAAATVTVAIHELDRPPAGARSASDGKLVRDPWAVAASTGSSNSPAKWVTALRGIGVETVRGFADDKNLYRAATPSGVHATGILTWSSGSTQTFPVHDMAGWRSYVARTIRKYPKVTSWEVWNEPPNFTADTSPADYAKIVVAAYDTAKKLNPKLRIGVAVKSTYIQWLGQALEAGAAGHFDYVTLHPYERASLLATGNEAVFMGIVPQVRAMLKAVSPKQANAPIEFSEVGVGVSAPGHHLANTVSEAVQANLLVKIYALSLAQGASSVAWFDAWDGDADGTTAPAYGLIARDGRKRPAFHAYANLIKTLGEHTRALGWQTTKDGAVVVVFSAKGGRTELIAWAKPGTTPTLTFDDGATVENPTTGTQKSGVRSLSLTTSAQLVHVTGQDRSDWRPQVAMTYKEPFDSVGGFDTVSYSAADGADGLWWINAPTQTVAKDGTVGVSAGGSSAVGLFVAPWLSAWDKSSITISVKVWGLKDNQGFNLKYDADQPVGSLDLNGQKASGDWAPAPKGVWTTLTWTIKDASLTGMYGPSIVLDSDSTAYSQYLIAGISVTRN